MERNWAEALPYPLAFFLPVTAWSLDYLADVSVSSGAVHPQFCLSVSLLSRGTVMQMFMCDQFSGRTLSRPPLHLQLLPDILSIHGDRKLSCKEPPHPHPPASKSAVSGFVSNCDMRWSFQFGKSPPLP